MQRSRTFRGSHFLAVQPCWPCSHSRQPCWRCRRPKWQPAAIFAGAGRHLGVEAQRQGKGVEFAKEVAAIIFGGTKNWHKGTHLRDAAEKVGLDFEYMEEAIANGNHANEIETNHNSLESVGHWGVPTSVFRGEPFFGQDRTDTLRWRLGKEGLRNH